MFSELLTKFEKNNHFVTAEYKKNKKKCHILNIFPVLENLTHMSAIIFRMRRLVQIVRGLISWLAYLLLFLTLYFFLALQTTQGEGWLGNNMILIHP